MEIKWYGTASLLFKAGEKTVLFDPFLPMNPALPRPDPAELAACGDIFITHGHFDHLLHVPEIVASGGGPVFCPGTAAEILRREGVKEKAIVVVKPGDLLERAPFRITVLKGKHVCIDPGIVLKTFFNRRVFVHRSNLGRLFKVNRRYPAGEVLAYFMEAEGKRILHLGSLNLDEKESYPGGVDILTLPYQGRSDLPDYALELVSRIEPKSIYLHHFDDSFPPISSPVDVKPFIKRMSESRPEIGVILPHASSSLTL